MKSSEKTRLSKTEGWLSIFTNIFLFILKYWAGLATGSIAIIADAWHTLSDSFSSVLLLVGVKVSDKPPDKDHPFGHGRAELITSIIIGLLLALIAFSFIRESVVKLIEREIVEYSTFAIAATAISIIFKELLAQYAFWAGRKVKSNILKADGWHHRSDAISSVVILAGIFFSPYAWWIDGALGITVALLIGYAAYEVLRDSISQILGKRPDVKLLEKIKLICREIGGEGISAHHFHLHEYGDHREMTFHIRLDPEITLQNAHDIATEIEETIEKQLDLIVTIHMEPQRLN